MHQLRAFLTVARCNNLTRASEQLHLTQPAVSKQIKSLEDELGVLLFERTSGGMSLTRNGEVLLPFADKTLASAVELISTSGRLRGELSGIVKLGTIIDPESLGLGDFLSWMLKYHPKVVIKLLHGISGWVLNQVQAGDLDAGYYLGEVALPDIAAFEIRTVSYVIIAPTGWRGQIEAADWAALARLPWVGTPMLSSQYRIVKEFFAQRGLTTNTVIEADQESSMLNLVKEGIGLCIMREEIARPRAQLKEIEIWNEVSWQCPLSFVYRKSRADDATIVSMLKIISERTRHSRTECS